MNLELRSIVRAGDLKNERLTLRVLSDLDLGDFLVAQSGYATDFPTTNFFHTFWFPYKKVSKGDLVVIYTKAGSNRERVLDRGNTAHFFYWDLTSPIWNESNRGALVLFAPQWQSESSEKLR